MYKVLKPALIRLAQLLFISFPFNAAYSQAADVSLMAQSGIPAGLLFENQSVPYLFWVEMEKGRLHLLERTEAGSYLKRKTVPISIGKQGFGKQVEGDQRTPVGIYQMTSFLSDQQLDDFYGFGAYPLNYPNIWDRMLKRTGHGIWLHGLPKGLDSRPLLDSNGCVIIDNETLSQFGEQIKVGQSMIVLAESLEWLQPGDVQPDADVLDAIDRWQADWTSLDTSAYLSNYHADFTDTKRNLAQWKAYKSRVNGRKSYINVDFSELSVVAYPGEENLVAMRFYQDYDSSNFSWHGWKYLLWRRDGSGSWRILYEGNG